MFVARHCPSKTLVVVKQTNVDIQNAEQFENLKVCACFEVYLYFRLSLFTESSTDIGYLIALHHCWFCIH